jgi:hypothetical protein
MLFVSVGCLDSKSFPTSTSVTHTSAAVTQILMVSMFGPEDAANGALQLGATAADLGANAPQWYHSVSTPGAPAEARTETNSILTVRRVKGSAVAAANHALITPGTVGMSGGGGQPMRLFHHPPQVTYQQEITRRQPALQAALWKAMAAANVEHKKWEFCGRRSWSLSLPCIQHMHEVRGGRS